MAIYINVDQQRFNQLQSELERQNIQGVSCDPNTNTIQVDINEVSGSNLERLNNIFSRYNLPPLDPYQDSFTRASLSPPKLDISNLSQLLLELQTKLSGEQNAGAKQQVATNADQQRAQRTKIADQLRAAAAEMEKAKKAGEIGKIFGWISFAVTVAIASSLILLGAINPVFGPIMIAVGVVLAIQAYDQAVTLTAKDGETPQTFGSFMNEQAINAIQSIFGVDEAAATDIVNKGNEKLSDLLLVLGGQLVAVLSEKIAKACGASDEVALYIKCGFMIATVVVQMAACMAATIATAGAATAITGPHIALLIGQAISATLMILNGVAQIGQGASQAAKVSFIYKADQFIADNEEQAKVIALLQAQLEQLLEYLRELFQDLEESVSRAMSNITSTHQTQSKIIAI